MASLPTTGDARDAGFDPDRLARVAAAMRADVQAERYDGCELVVARHGRVALHVQVGFADRAAGRAVEPAQPFVTMSIGKQLTVVAALTRLERGDFELTTRVADVIPEFGCRGKERITVEHLLTHRAGLPMMLPTMPPELAGDLAAVVAATCGTLAEHAPGRRVQYSALVAHAILAEMVRRVDGGRRSFRDILADDLLGPLGMRDTALGCPARLALRLAPVVARDRRPGLFQPEFLEAMGGILGPDTEIPAGGFVSTAPDFHRFAEMLRRGGELDGVRILSPATVAALAVVRTGDEPNPLFAYTEGMRGWPPFPANLGLGFFVRGQGLFPMPFGLLAPPPTFGGLGAGSTAFWVDPVHQVTYVFLSSGLMEDSYSVERHQRLSDLVHAAVLR